MKFTLLTPTGDRPEAFTLCERWIRRQTLQPVRWVVIDDGEKPTVCTRGQVYHYLPELRGPGSLVSKLRFFIETGQVDEGEAVAIIEDDDWYHPRYLEIQARRMADGFKVVGEGCAIYYNVRERWWYAHANLQHASLCQTAMRTEALPVLLKRTNESNPFIDVRFWATAGPDSCVFHPHKFPTTVGIKSMPGRKGYGMGHKARHPQALEDRSLIKLHSLIGSDAAAYEPFFNHSS